MISDDSPCSYSFHAREVLMDSATETIPVDQSVYGLVVFLVIFLLFATLTSGLLVCLTKIWCGFRNGEAARERQLSLRQSPAMIDEDSDEESMTPQPQRPSIAGRRFSQRLMSYVHRLGDNKGVNKEVTTPDPPSPKIYGADAEPLPTISTEVSSQIRNGSICHDPTTVVHV